MNPLLVSLIKRMPVVGDMISAFDGKKDNKEPAPNRARGPPGRPSNTRYPRKYNPVSGSMEVFIPCKNE